MALRSFRYAPESHLEDMSYLLAHLKADPVAGDIATIVEAGVAALKVQMEDWSTKHSAVVEAQTALVNMDETLHNAVRSAYNATLEDVRQNRRAPKFLTYFPRGMMAITNSPYADEVTAVRSLAEHGLQDPNPKIQEQAALLRAAADQMEAALARRAQALVAESVSYGRLQVQKIQSIDTCRVAGHRLLEMYPNERDRVRSFFRPVYRRSRPTTPTEEGPAPAAEAAVTPAPATPTLVLSEAATIP